MLTVLDEQGRFFEKTMFRQQGGLKAECFMTTSVLVTLSQYSNHGQFF